MGLNIVALIVEYLVLPEKRIHLTFSYYLDYIGSAFVFSLLFALFQVFAIGWDKWWKILILPTIILSFQCLLSFPPDPMGDGLEAAYTASEIWAKGFDVVLNRFNLWDLVRLFCTAFLWLYQVALLFLINRIHSIENDRS